MLSLCDFLTCFSRLTLKMARPEPARQRKSFKILGLAGASIWLQKNVGKWTFDGGAGYQVVPQDAFRNSPFTGWRVKKELSEQLE